MCISIPRGAVKSLQLCGRISTQQVFQFQEVQLKEYSFPKRQRYFEFQFQEVQLKVRWAICPIWVLRISIPRGAVKRFSMGCHRRASSSISIPRGAVKSMSRGGANVAHSFISIPRGAVKRHLKT